MVEDASPIPASLVAERAGDPAFADAGRPGDQKPFGAVDPVAGDELLEQGAVDAAWGSQVDILDDGVLPQRGELEARGQAFGVALGRLAIDHQADPLLEREGGDVGRSALVLEGLGHSGQAEGDQTFMRWMGKHRVSFLVSGSSRGRGCWRDGRARGPNARPHQGKRDRGRS
jgi:hypothetical protein